MYFGTLPATFSAPCIRDFTTSMMRLVRMASLDSEISYLAGSWIANMRSNLCQKPVCGTGKNRRPYPTGGTTGKKGPYRYLLTVFLTKLAFGKLKRYEDSEFSPYNAKITLTGIESTRERLT